MGRTATELQDKVKVKGEMFGARGCSGGCMCDPCECDPCTCGSDDLHPNPPRWRVSGCFIREGELQGVDVTGLVLVSLSLPLRAEPGSPWREVLLVDSRASDQQLAALLARFEPELVSMPVAYRTAERPLPAVYRVPMTYTRSGRPTLWMVCSPETLELVRAGAVTSEPFVWSYGGAMARQRFF